MIINDILCHGKKEFMEESKENIEKRLLKIETKLSYIEDFCDKIQEVTLAQEKLIARQEAKIKELYARMTLLQESLEDIPNRKPPHY